MHRISRTAFTLMEMLLVISIITLLISILQPSLQQAKRNAKAVKCSSQVGQMSRAVISYSDEHAGRMFPFVHTAGNYWIGKLSRYWNNDDLIMLCPEATVPSYGLGDAFRAWGPSGGWMDNKKGSYGMNLWWLSTGDSVGDPNMVASGYIRHVDSATSDMPVFGDSQWVGAWPDDQDLLPTNFQAPPNTHALGYFMSRFCMDRHTMQINVGFIDGSARLVKIPDLWKLRWHRTFEPGNPVVP